MLHTYLFSLRADLGRHALDPLADELVDKLGICGSDGQR